MAMHAPVHRNIGRFPLKEKRMRTTPELRRGPLIATNWAGAANAASNGKRPALANTMAATFAGPFGPPVLGPSPQNKVVVLLRRNDAHHREECHSRGGCRYCGGGALRMDRPGFRFGLNSNEVRLSGLANRLLCIG